MFSLFSLSSAAFAQVRALDCAESSDSSICKIANLPIGSVLGSLLNFVFVIAVVLALGFLVYGGLRWLTSGGEKDRVDSARSTIIAAIIGLTIVFLSFFVINFVLQFITGQGLSGLSIPTLVGESVQNRQSSPSPLPASLIEPKIKESSNGLLEVELIASKSSNLVDNIKEGFSYNNTYPGPIIKLKAGDVLKIKLTNKTSEDTNLYFQGIQALAETSPSNLSVKVSPNSSFIYKYQLPESHPGGIYMYHPLLYGRSEKQVVNGMVGAVVVKGTIDELPGIKGLPERLLILSTLSSRSEIQSPTVRLVNGQRNPLFIIRPGEIQRWRILNASANDFYYLAIPGVSFAIIARDGNTTQKPIFTQSELMAPGDSIEILIIGPPPGTYRVVSLPFDQGSIRYPQDQFMTIRSEGEPISGFIMPESLLKYENLQKVKVDNKRKFIFTVEKTSNMQRFLINGKTFDSNRVDLTVKQNAIEEWRVENLSQEWLAFSLQGFPFQVIEVNGVPIERFGLDNTFGIPPKSIIVLRIHFKDFYGKFLLFSRVLFQADHGMMQVVQVMHSNVPKE